MSIRTPSQLRIGLVLLGILGLAGLQGACVENPSEENQTNQEYCRQNPTHCTAQPQGE